MTSSPLVQTRLEYLMREVQPLKAGFDVLQDHVIITDANGVILYANKAVERTTGYSVDEVMGGVPPSCGAVLCQRNFTTRCGTR